MAGAIPRTTLSPGRRRSSPETGPGAPRATSQARCRCGWDSGRDTPRCCSKPTSSRLWIKERLDMKRRDPYLTRREMLSRTGMGMGMVALTSTLGGAGCLEAASLLPAGSLNPLAPKKPPLPAKAKRVLHLFMNGGASHVDTFDPKPSLAKFAGKPIPITLKTERRTGAAFPSPFTFRKFGQSGIEVSEIFSNIGAEVDNLCVVRSM